MNKRGQELSTNTIILIILGIAVLVVLIVGFTVGWGKLAPWLSSSNVDSIKTQCEVACSTGSVYGYCKEVRTLNDGENKYSGTCQLFSSSEPVNGVDYSIYGIVACPTITCPASEQ